jgi:phospholipid transport system substrate-binding protein
MQRIRDSMDCGHRWVTVCLVLAAVLGFAQGAQAQSTGPERLIEALTSDVMDGIKADAAIQSGDVDRVFALVDAKVMPHVDVRRMTSSAVGRHWRQASPQQQQRLQDEFKELLIRSYAGALAQVKDETVKLMPRKRAVGDAYAVIRTEVRGRGDPIRLDYRLHETPTGWKIYDVSVVGVWLAQNYRNSFAREIGSSGIDGLIERLSEKNRGAGKP